MYSLKSHTASEILTAIYAGEQIWQLDSGCSGHDDIMIGSRDLCESDIVSFLDDDERPTFDATGWTLRRSEGSELDTLRDEMLERVRSADIVVKTADLVSTTDVIVPIEVHLHPDCTVSACYDGAEDVSYRSLADLEFAHQIDIPREGEVLGWDLRHPMIF